MTEAFRDLSLQRKVTLLIGLASGIALVLAALGVLLYDLTTAQPRASRDLTAQADLVRINTTAALLFQDAEAATENLGTLRAKREIGAAAIYDAGGRLFASYLRPPATDFPFDSIPPSLVPGTKVSERHLTLTQAIRTEGQLAGWLVLRYELPTFLARLPQYGIVAGVVVLVLVTVSALLAWFLRSSIAAPLLALESTTRAVTHRKDYGLRAVKQGEDEIGRLTDSFNQMLATLEESTRLLMEAMAAARMSPWVWNLADESIVWGGNEERIFGPAGAPRDTSFRAFLDRVHSADRPRVEESFAHAAWSGTPSELDFRVNASGGRDRWLSMRGQTERDAGGKPVRIFGLVLDITERRQLEEQLVQAQKMEAIGQLAGGIAHDFNNLLTAILGYARFAMSALPQDSQVRADVAEIERAGSRAAALTGQLLAYARRQMIAPKASNLNELIMPMTSMLQRLLGEDIVLQVRATGDLWATRVDPNQLEQVVLNLGVNARDAMPAGGQLTIQTRNVVLDEDEAREYAGIDAGRFVALAVSDTGEGMDMATRDRIFEPFFTTKEQGKGTGLGLAVCYGIVAQSGGSIRVDSEVGAGTTFTVLLPEAPSAAAPMAALPPEPAPAGQETVLVVEDEPQVRSLAVRTLSEHGYELLEAKSGADALAVAEAYEGTVQLLVTDVVMPGMNGKEVAARLGERYPGLRIIYMSGYTDHAIVRHGVIEQGVAFIAKPFAPAALARAVRDVLDARIDGSWPLESASLSPHQ